ncbi:hypothetical protein GF380_05610 [Candidatus Uhrbacteria bacterium]|nr:hypothetical protein [Candidatus Uhrbacteria bacterium]
MVNNPIVAHLLAMSQHWLQHFGCARQAWGLLRHPQLPAMLHHPKRLPLCVRHAPVARRYLRLLAPIPWQHFPERDLSTDWGIPTVPYVPFVASFLVKLDAKLTYMSSLRDYLVEHPVLTTVLGFPLPRTYGAVTAPILDASLPTHRHFARILRTLPNANLQWLLGETVHLLQTEFAAVSDDFGQAISLDTKHILAWVKENNPKAYVTDRFDKNRQPAGDPDCKLGCKRKHNQRVPGEKPSASNDPPTPRSNPRSPQGVPVGEYYWGYASGVVATKIPDWAEIVLAELTQPFNASDLSYFHPLMSDTERRLGFRPHFGAFDAGFDAWYVYEHFNRENEPWQSAFAAVPWAKRGPKRTFDADGLPLCEAGLAMPLKHTYMARKTLVPHQKGRYACPLQYPEPTAEACPVDHKRWAKGGCVTTLATSIGARLRHQIDRDSALYKRIYDQRTATERINSQAKALGIERPKLRNQRAITNINTLIYVLINLRALHRIRAKKAERSLAA